MKTKHVFRTFVVLVALLAAVLFSPSVAKASGAATFTFSDDAIETNAPETSYKIKDGNALTISESGTYVLTGSCAEGSVSVAKELEVTLVLDNFSLSSTTTAPIAVKKSATVTIHLEGASTLTDNEPVKKEDVEDDFEHACIKVKAGSTVTFCGEGELTCVANSYNGIKGAAESALIFNQTGTVNVTGNVSGYAFTAGAVNNGIAADGSVTINNGTFNIAVKNDGIKSEPDVGKVDDPESVTDTASEGKVVINGGTININCDGDAIQADTALNINGGTFTIKTWNGYNTSGSKYNTNNETGKQYPFNPDDASGKGLKASGDRAEDQGITPAINITGGTFVIDSVDDAIHSDGTVTITGGVFMIDSGDDGMHAETDLVLGTKGGTIARDPDVNILTSYEGLEGATVTIESGNYSIQAKDDGVNAAGGSSNGPGGSGWFPGVFPGGGGNDRNKYNITINGGNVYVLCDGDGLDSNGGLYLYGGTIAVFSMSSGDNSALDADGTRVIDGAYVFTAGAQGVDGTAKSSWFGSNQKYTTKAARYSKGTVVYVMAGSTYITNVQLPKQATYIMYSMPSYTPTISTGSTYYPCNYGYYSHVHTWDEGVVTTEATEDAPGVMTYTCTTCDATETQTIPALVHIDACDHDLAPTGFVGTFVVDGGGASINVYYTKDFSEPSETGAYVAAARNGDTGEIDETGEGQINFAVVCQDGYSVTGVKVEGDYKNLKDISSDLAGGWRITKVAGDLTITITTDQCKHENVTADDITWNWDTLAEKEGVTASFHCNDCNADYKVSATVTSVFTEPDTITMTATAKVGDREFTDVKTAAPYVATFAGDEGVESISVFYLQSNTTPDETNVTSTLVRDAKKTGEPIVNGDGQLNFLVTLKDGYVIDAVTATKGAYKNIKGEEDTGVANMYRITKITGDLTVTITTTQIIDISDAVVTAQKQKYTGSPIEPEVTVTLADGTVLDPADYTVAYGNNTEVGTATITVTATGALYTGTATGEFEIYRGGWTKYEDTWCYVENDGSLRTDDWADWQGKYYYFGSDGKLMEEGLAPYEPTGKLYLIKNYVVSKGWYESDDSWYYFGSDYEAYTNQWIYFNGTYYYFGSDSKLVTNGWGTYQGVYYYLGADGKVVTNGWADYEGQKYYMGANGRAVVSNWVLDGEDYYYMAADGKPVVNGSIEYNGTTYYFDADGVCTGTIAPE